MKNLEKKWTNNAAETRKKWLKQFWTWMINVPLWLLNILKSWWLKVDERDEKRFDKSEEKRKKNWKETTWWVKKTIRRNLIKVIIMGSLATWYWIYEMTGSGKAQEEDAETTETIEVVKWSYKEKFWDDKKIFIIDVSDNNELNKEKFANWNEERRGREQEDVRGVSWVYMRIQKESGADEDYEKFYQWIKEYNETAKQWQEIAIWWYIYFNKSTNSITDAWIEEQVNSAIKRLNIINDSTDWITDLIPMLDFEFSRAETKRRRKKHKWEDYPKATSEQWKKYINAALKRLQLFEQKTWIVPWIYTGWSIYHDYFLNDPRFAKKYPVWIASYNEERVDQSEDWHSVLIWPQKKPVEFEADIVQFSDNINNSWFWTEKWWNLDWSSTTKDKFIELIIRNGDAPNDIDEEATENIENNENNEE